MTSSTNMSKEDIDKAVKEAEVYAAEDKKRKEDVDTRNSADQLVYTTEKALSEMGDKVTEDEKKDITAASDALKEALKGTDLEAIKAKQDELQKKFYAVSERVYKEAAAAQQAAQGGAQAGPQDANGGADNVYEADFKDADEDKK